MANPLLEALGFVGNVLDTPGALVRNTLGGRNPLQGVFNPEERTTGRQLLEAMGVLDQNTEGLDAGDVAGFGAEMLLDPLNLVGGFALRGVGKAAKQAKAANRSSEAMRRMGAMPEELLRETRITGPVYHGSPTPGLSARNLMEGAGQTTGNTGHYGKGVYFATNPDEAARFINHVPAEDGGSLVAARIHAKNPYVTQAAGPEQFMDELQAMTGKQLVPSDVAEARKLYGASPWLDYPPAGDFYKHRAPEMARDVLRDQGYDAVRTGFGMGADEVVAFSPSQIFTTDVAPAMRDVPRRSPLLAALLGYNALKTGRN